MEDIITRTYVGSPMDIQRAITEFLQFNPEYEVAGRTQQRRSDSPDEDIAYITYQRKEGSNG